MSTDDKQATSTGEESPGEGRGNGAGAAPRLAVLRRPWVEFVEKHRLHASKAREVVVNTFLQTRGHIDLNELHLRVKRRHPSMSLATVYRTVKLMEEAGIAHARNFTNRGTIYEVAVGRAHHDHLICESCGSITEFTDETIERLQDDIARQYGFTLLRHRHELFGRCVDCRKKAALEPV